MSLFTEMHKSSQASSFMHASGNNDRQLQAFMKFRARFFKDFSLAFDVCINLSAETEC